MLLISAKIQFIELCGTSVVLYPGFMILTLGRIMILLGIKSFNRPDVSGAERRSRNGALKY